MDRQPHYPSREKIVAESIKEVVSELRMIEAADYIAFIRLEQYANIADIVDSAAELFFIPGTLRLGHGGDVHAGWSLPPRVMLDLELKPAGATVYFTLIMSDAHAAVDVTYVSFDQPSDDPDENSAFLESALAAARIRKTPPMRMAG